MLLVASSFVIILKYSMLISSINLKTEIVLIMGTPELTTQKVEIHHLFLVLSVFLMDLSFINCQMETTVSFLPMSIQILDGNSLGEIKRKKKKQPDPNGSHYFLWLYPQYKTKKFFTISSTSSFSCSSIVSPFFLLFGRS